MNVCRTCSAPISRGSKLGYCKNHRGDAMRMFYFLNPDAKDRARATIRRNGSTEHARQRRSEAAKRIGLHAIGWKAMTPEALERRARTISENRMAWCPRELRDEYHHLVRSKKLPTAEARAIILAQHEANMAKFRASIGGGE